MVQKVVRDYFKLITTKPSNSRPMQIGNLKTASGRRDIDVCSIRLLKHFMYGVNTDLRNNRHSTTLSLVSPRKERRNSILMTCHYPDVSSASDWLKQISLAARPIRSNTQIWAVTRHQFEISPFVPQTSSLRRETSFGVAKCRLFLSGYVKTCRTEFRA